MMLALVSLLMGMVVAQRFGVLILVPFTLLALIVAIGSGIARAESLWTVFATAAVAITSVQIGYLLGAGVHHVLLVARASRLHSGSLPSALPPRRTAH
jgi:hypothetical protein